jgi:hypothetical protein
MLAEDIIHAPLDMSMYVAEGEDYRKAGGSNRGIRTASQISLTLAWRG